MRLAVSQELSGGYKDRVYGCTYDAAGLEGMGQDEDSDDRARRLGGDQHPRGCVARRLRQQQVVDDLVVGIGCCIGQQQCAIECEQRGKPPTTPPY